MKYDITFPAAEAMIAQERKAAADSLELDYSKRIAFQVAEDIHRQSWLACHQRSVDAVLETLNELSNIDDFKLTVLDEAARQIEQRRIKGNAIRATLRVKSQPAF